MKTKTLALALILVVIAVLAPATYAIANSNTNGSLYGTMGGMMGDTNEFGDEEWWDEMRRHMEEHWEELEDNGNYRYGRSGRYRHGCH